MMFSLPVCAGQEISIQDGPQGYLSVPDSSLWEYQVTPAVLLIHDWWGLTPSMREAADHLAAKGFLALAVDLYYGDQPQDVLEAQKRMRTLPGNLVRKDLLAALRFLKNDQDQAPKKIAVIGWSEGADWAMKLALEKDAPLDVLIVMVGGLVRDRDELRPLRVPVLGIFASDDPSVPIHEVNSFEFEMQQLGKRIEIQRVPHARHDFMDSRSDYYDPKAADEAWQRTLLFLKANLA